MKNSRQIAKDVMPLAKIIGDACAWTGYTLCTSVFLKLLSSNPDVVAKSASGRRSYCDKRVNGHRVKIFLKEGVAIPGSTLYSLQKLLSEVYRVSVVVKVRYWKDYTSRFAQSYISFYIPY